MTASRNPKSRLVVVATWALWMMCVPLLALAPAATAMVECCCGEHAVDDDCGCVDCNGGDMTPSENTQVRGCVPQGPVATLMAVPVFEGPLDELMPQVVSPTLLAQTAFHTLLGEPSRPPDPRPPR